MALMTIAQYAKHRGRDAKAIRYAIEGGRITQRDDGMIDSAQADLEWEANTDEAQAARGGPGKALPSLPALDTEPAVPLNSETSKASDYAKARAATQIYEARLKKLRYEERAKTLVPKKDVEDAAFQAFRCIRDACMNIPPRIAALMASESDQEKCFQILETEIVRIFDDFAAGRTT